MDQNKGRLYLLAASVIWGSGFIATQQAVDAAYSPAFILLVRFALASLLLRVFFRKRMRGLSQVEWRAGMICGLSFFLGFLLQTYGLIGTTPSMNAFLTATSVMIVPFFVWLIFRHAPHSVVFAGCFVCFLGVVILSLRSGEGFALSFGWGETLTLLSAVSFALHTVCLGYYASRLDPIRLTYIQTFTSAVCSGLYFLLADRGFGQFEPRLALLSILYLTVFNTFIAFLLQSIGQSKVPPAQAILIICCESLFASIFSLLIGYDELRWQLIVGGALIMGAIVLTELFAARLEAKKAEAAKNQARANTAP